MKTPVKEREQIIARLNDAILGSGMTQKEIGEKACIEEYTISRILHTKRTLSAMELVRLAVALEMPVEEFLYEDDD